MCSLEISASKENILLEELRLSVEGLEDKVAKADIQTLFNELWLLIMLRCTDLNVSAALESVKLMRNAVRYKHSDWFRKLIPDALEKLIMSDAIVVLKDKDSNGNCVILIRIKSWNEKIFSAEDFNVSVMIILMELLESDIQMQTKGSVLVIDMSGLSFAQARQTTPSHLKKTIDLVFSSTPLKVNGIHVVNLNYMVNALVKIAKPLLPRKAASILFTHNSPQTLHSYVDRRSLPTWLGGEYPDDQVSNSFVKDSCFKRDRIKWYNKFVEVASEEKP